MKTEKEKNTRLEIRVNSEDLKLLKIASYSIGLTPSKMIRMFIDTTVTALKVKVKKGEIKLEDFETVFNDKL